MKDDELKEYLESLNKRSVVYLLLLIVKEYPQTKFQLIELINEIREQNAAH